MSESFQPTDFAKLAFDPAADPGLVCAECKRPLATPHLGTCSGSLMHGGTGIVGLVRVEGGDDPA